MTRFYARFYEPTDEKVIRHLVNLWTALLLAMSIAVFFGGVSSLTLIAPRDPVLQISTRLLFWIFAALGFGVALVCLFAENLRLKLALILWLALNVAVYSAGLRWSGCKDFSPYLGNLVDAFLITPATAFFLLKAIFLCLLIGSAAPLLWLQLNKFKNSAGLSLKMSCPACGGHISFFNQNLGQQTPCPHCEKSIILRESGSLKMSCFFCQGHIAFPAHALGTKMPCPHCKRDITLLEPK